MELNSIRAHDAQITHLVSFTPAGQQKAIKETGLEPISLLNRIHFGRATKEVS
jgi:hypothetical protein